MPPSAWIAIEKFVQQGVWLLLFFILAPILGPRPYGLFAIAMVFIGFCELVLIDATVEALLGMEPLDSKHLRTANLFSLSLAVFIGVVLFLSAPLIGWTFGDAELGSIFRALSVLPVAAALTTAPNAILKSQLRFGPLALRSILSLAIGGACGVVLALQGAGVWALVAQVLVQRAAEITILWSSARIRFGIGWSRPHFVDLRHFATHVFISRGSAFVGAQIPRLILGFFLGPYELGLFVFAARLPDMLLYTTVVPTTVVARVTLRQYAPGQKDLQTAFGRLIGDTALVAFPICVGAAAVMPQVFAVALDERWQPAVLSSQLMILSVLPMLVYFAASSLLLAMKHPQEEAKISMAQIASNTLCVLAAAPFGLTAVCSAIVLRHLLLMPMLLSMLERCCGIIPRSILTALGPALIASLAMGAAVTLAGPIAGHRLGQAASLVVLVGLGVLVYAIVAGFVARKGAWRIISSLRKIAAKRETAPPLE